MKTNFEKLYNSRINRFIERLQNLLYSEKEQFNARFAHYKSKEPLPFSARPNSFQPIEKGQMWGENWQRAWFKCDAHIPDAWKGQHVVAVIDIGGEGLVYNHNGAPINAVSFHTVWAPHVFKRDRLLITKAAQGGESVQLWIDATAAQLFGLEENKETDLRPVRYGDHRACLGDCFLAIFREDVWHLLLDIKVLFDLMNTLPEKSVRRARILHALNKAADIFQPDKKSVSNCITILSKELEKTASPSTLSTTAVGHAHIDTGWLWPVHETYRKCARTFSAQLRNIEKYPDYIFGASQAQHYHFVKKYYPELYTQIKEQIAKGRWEVQGGMWVEADCNITGGESLVRQVLYGKRFFQHEFGVDVKNLWLPDVFGYSAALPQILKKSGIDYFITQKISWNQFNTFPHHTFKWRGIDGTEIITHFPPEDNYNSELKPSQLIYAQDNFQEKAFLDEYLTLFGIGDGGGGPTEEQIESGLRQHDLEGAPRVKFESAQTFLNRLANDEKELSTWVGELYLELHRGTLTTQAYNKKMNRQLEMKLRELEIIYSCTLAQYPAAKLEKMWKLLLLNQFHDIIPGSSITEVYEDSKQDYLHLTHQVEELKKSAADILLEPKEGSLVLYNSLSCEWIGSVELPETWHKHAVSCNGKELAIQIEETKSIVSVEIPPLSSITLKKLEVIEEKNKYTPNPLILENELVRYTFAENGTLTNIYDKKAEREVLDREKFGNVLSLYEDRPANWDAWDIDIYYENQKLEQAHAVSFKQITGPVRQGLHFSLQIGHSKIEQKIHLQPHSKRLDFNTHVEWNELHKMLRVAFHTNIKSDKASFEIQYGHVKRPTHRNTSWDMARFEVAAQRWADLSEYNYGIALLNDCKYGHKVVDGTLDLNLLRASSSPDPNADQRGHNFTFSIFPHTDALAKSDVIQQAAVLNQQPIIFSNSSGTIQLPFSFNSKDVILETIKKAEDEEAIVLRFYEPYGKTACCSLGLKNKTKVWECDLLENINLPIENANDMIDLQFQAFEIKTLKIEHDKS